MNLKQPVCALALIVSLAACGGGGDDDPPPPPPPDPFAEVDRAANAAYTAQGISGMGVAIYDAQGVKRFEKMYGSFSADQRVAIASASKMVSGLPGRRFSRRNSRHRSDSGPMCCITPRLARRWARPIH